MQYKIHSFIRLNDLAAMIHSLSILVSHSNLFRISDMPKTTYSFRLSADFSLIGCVKNEDHFVLDKSL